MIRSLVTFTLIFLTACGSSKEPATKSVALEKERLLTESDFKQAVSAYLRNGGGPMVSTYDIALVDLNGDYRPEGLVMMNTPFSTWCHLAGCTLLIFEAHSNNKITLNSRIQPIRGPLFFHGTEGKWKKIVARQDGINRDARYIELKNTGTGYPAFTLNAPDYYGSRPQSDESYFY